MEVAVSSSVTSCKLVVRNEYSRRFCCLHLQNKSISSVTNTTVLHQNLFNLLSHNSEIFTIRRLRSVIPRTGSFAFYQKNNFISETDRSQGRVRRGLQESLYVNRCGVSWLLISYFGLLRFIIDICALNWRISHFCD